MTRHGRLRQRLRSKLLVGALGQEVPHLHLQLHLRMVAAPLRPHQLVLCPMIQCEVAAPAAPAPLVWVLRRVQRLLVLVLVLVLLHLLVLVRLI